MRKMISKNHEMFDQALDGMLKAQPGELVRMKNDYSYTLYQKNILNNKVQIIISGGGSFGPLFPGFVKKGLADAMCHGEFDCAPNAYALYEVAKKIHRGKGILFLTNNFTGDFLNNDMAQELLAMDKIKSKVCYVSDDIFSAIGEKREKRGGLFGISTLIKIAQKAAGNGFELEEIHRIVEKASKRTATLTVCLNQVGKQMAFGAGFSGEDSVVTKDDTSAENMADNIVDYLLKEVEYGKTGKVYFTVNRMLKATYIEGYVVLNLIFENLQAKGYEVGGCYVGSYFDAFDENGYIVSFLLADTELESYMQSISGYEFTI